MVSVPAGSGHAAGALRTSPSAATERAEHTNEGLPLLQSECQKCCELEASLAFARAQHAEELDRLRSQHAEELEQERSEWRRRVHLCEETEQRSVERLQEERHRWGEEEEAQAQHSGRLAQEASSVSRLRRELAAEAVQAEGAARWQQLALEASTQLAEAESQREESLDSAAQARKRAVQAERQRRELERRGKGGENTRLREELRALTDERDALSLRAERLVPLLQAARGEEAKLQQSLTEESQVAAARAFAATEECAEMVRVREQASKARRSLQSELDAITSEIQDAQWQRKHAHQELVKEQRQRADELRRHRMAVVDRQNQKAEMEQLQRQLHWAEAALQAQMEERPVGVHHRAERKRPHARKSHEHEQPAAPEPRGLSSGAGARTALGGDELQDLGDVDAEGLAPCASSASSSARHGQSTPPLGTCDGSANDHVAAHEAGTRLFEMIARAKERAGQRRLLRGTQEELRVKAHALEELFARESDAGGPS